MEKKQKVAIRSTTLNLKEWSTKVCDPVQNLGMRNFPFNYIVII